MCLSTLNTPIDMPKNEPTSHACFKELKNSHYFVCGYVYIHAFQLSFAAGLT